MSKTTRKQVSALEKVTILKAHFIDRLLVSDVCDKYQIAPSVFYKWQKNLFENGTAAFERAPDPAPNQQKIADLEKRIATKDAVIVERVYRLKKKNGGFLRGAGWSLICVMPLARQLLPNLPSHDKATTTIKSRPCQSQGLFRIYSDQSDESMVDFLPRLN